MENITDLLKDAFSDVQINFEDLQPNDGTNSSQTQLAMDKDLKDIRKLWATSLPNSKTITDVYKQEVNADSSDNVEGSALHNRADVKAGSTTYLHCGVDYEQGLKQTIMETQELNQAFEEYTVEGESRKGDSEAGVLADVNTQREETFREEETAKLPFEFPEDLEISSAECHGTMEQTSSDPVCSGTQTMQRSSSVSDEEETGSCDAEDQDWKPDGNTDKLFVAGCHVRYGLREFTEEDQEQVEESLAEYPSDLSHSETEICAENGDQLSIPLDSSLCPDHSAHEKKDSSRVEEGNFQESDGKIDGPATDSAEINKLEFNQLSNMVDVNVSLQRANTNEDNLQEILMKEYITVEDSKNKEDSGDERDVNDQPGYDSDISNDDHSTSQEETSFLSSEKEEWESVTQHDNDREETLRVDNNINNIETNKDDIDGSHLEKPICSADSLALSASLTEAKERTSKCKTSLSCREYNESNEQPTELHPNIEIVQLGSAIKEHGQSPSEVTGNIRDTNTLIPEDFWSSVLMDDDNLRLDEYNWNLTEGELPEANLIEEENQGDCEEEEKNERDWGKEKPRIEAFFQFYGDQAETQGEAGRNQKVTFCLDHELSEYEEDSESSEEEQHNKPQTPVTTVKPEYHSESDEPQDKLFHPEKPKTRPQEQEHVSPAVKMQPRRNFCLAVLKSALALGLMTAIGVVSFWWAAESLDWTH